MIKLIKEDWVEDNNKISDLVWEIESTGDNKKIEQCYDFIHHACDNIDDVFDGDSYNLEDAAWGYGIHYILDELTNILNGRGDDFYKVESYKRLKEQDVEIDVKHEGILEVPEGKNVDDLPMSHFEKLAKKKGLGKITKALNNLQVWNKKKDPKLSKWAGDMIDKLNKKLKKDESIKEYYIGSEYGEYFDEYSLRQRYNTMMMLDKLDDIINLYHDLGGDFDEFAIEATERGFSKIDIFIVGLCVEGIPVKEIEKRLRTLHLMDESIPRKRFNEGWHNGDATISFTHNDDLEADLEEFLFDLFSDNPDVFEFDWSGKNTILYLACDEDDYKYIKWFIEDWKYKHRDEYDEFDESLKRRGW